mmetsp:Transcript_3786/g.13387  ORF Transcript_3786/g.13387 Transcript_3786/m.13387 type:complete len:229 (+) Transcript_3786:46-732(+)|eukprot:CAMPEP_0114613338 /NCGR_PEP_ID=MMETSP0168-20121206/5081_1 /TAXON_ID=95228 ORGANISM="Vannella sp., Strain DIVA3 517/6/12" /NCGR_SAMPLE_ID=MMETSP0168 /ASSEMBLY_ACC=CAM_ASM_000044 /LENGTH=228 /DNA_ID=CAMNT_0001824341 /DNA_START=136 /DNA_END=822 /DNA_ORIENTATION=+
MGCAESSPAPRRSVAIAPDYSSATGYDSKKILLKVILLGDSGVGKTSLMSKFVNHKFDGVYKATIGADFLTKEMRIGKKTVTMQIWDTAGQERYESLGGAFYRGADACVLLFDVNRQETFARVGWWKEKFITHSTSSRGGQTKASTAFLAVVGNKTDVEEEDGSPSRQVTAKAARQWAADQTGAANADGMPYFETSAKTGAGVEDVFVMIARRALGDIVKATGDSGPL